MAVKNYVKLQSRLSTRQGIIVYQLRLDRGPESDTSARNDVNCVKKQLFH
jgi:hypothetical protein